MVDAVDALVAALIIVALVLCAVGIWALIELVNSMRSARALADDTRTRLVPLLEKLDVTVDAVNAELLRVDVIVTRFEEVADRLSDASDTVSDLANMPERIAGGIADKVRSWRSKRAARPESAEREPAAAEATAATVPSADDFATASDTSYQPAEADDSARPTQSIETEA